MANWIQGAIKHPGVFTAKAKSADMGVGTYASKVLSPSSKASTTTKRQAVLAQNLRKIGKKRKQHSASEKQMANQIVLGR